MLGKVLMIDHQSQEITVIYILYFLTYYENMFLENLPIIINRIEQTQYRFDSFYYVLIP